MIKLLKDTSKSITNANYNEFSFVLTILSVMSIIVFIMITGRWLFCYNSRRNGQSFAYCSARC